MLGVCFVLLPLLAAAIPVPDSPSFIGQGTDQLALALLQGHASQKENLVFSPLGLNVVLGIFAEGSRGASRDEIASSLHFPDDVQVVRTSYQSVLRKLSERNQANVPEMKNWFYIYKNYTVDEKLKDVLREYYLTDVKSVDRPEAFLESEKTKVKIPAGLQGKPTDHLINVDKEVESIIESASSPHKSDGEEAASNQQPALFDPAKDVKEEKKPETIDEEKPAILKEEKKPEIIKEDEKVPVAIKEEMPKTEDNKSAIVKEENEKKAEDIVKADEIPVVLSEEKLPGSANSQEKNQLSGIEKIELKKEENVVKSDLPSAAKLDEKAEVERKPFLEEVVMKEEEKKPLVEEAIMKEDDKVPMKEENEIKVDEEKKVQKVPEEMMVAMQRSVESLDDMSGSAVSIKKGSTSQMLVFNGLYFKGDFNTKFVKMPADDSRPFYKSNDEKVFVKTLYAEGLFNTADLPELKSRALELKYDGGRYSLLLLLPRQRDGLDQLVSDLASSSLSAIYEKLSEKLLNICLPTFQITTISKPLSASKTGGLLNVKKIFDPETADLTGISQEPGLFVEDLVQLVTFRADSNYTEANFLTASIASSRSDLEKLQLNQPFLFYLRDNSDGIIVVNGKVTDPTPTDDDFETTLMKNSVRRVVE